MPNIKLTNFTLFITKKNTNFTNSYKLKKKSILLIFDNFLYLPSPFTLFIYLI